MNELLEKIENVKTSLDQTQEVKEIKEWNQKVMEEKELLEDIKKYQETQDEKLKEKICSHQIFRDYKKKETNLNLLIMSINHKLKEIEIEEKECR